MMCSKDYIEHGENAVLHTYNRFSGCVGKRGRIHVYDLEGKEYLDFRAGIAMFSLGYGNQELIRL